MICFFLFVYIFFQVNNDTINNDRTSCCARSTEKGIIGKCMGEQWLFHKHNVLHKGKSVLGHMEPCRWDCDIVLLVDRRGIMRYGFQTTKLKNNKKTHTDIHIHIYATLLSHVHKKEFMVGFNYLRHQIKRTKCASQEYAG